jgi:hypothetical protein
MGAISAKLRSVAYPSGKGLGWWCPGCNEMHGVPVEGPQAWSWDRNIDAPTLSPSVLIQSGHYAPGHKGPACWCTYNRDNPGKTTVFQCGRCHVFVRGGMIEFLADCTHAFAGQTVPLPDLPKEIDA